MQWNIPEFENIQEFENQFKARREAIFLHDYDRGNIVFVNENMLNMYGYTLQEALDIHLENIISGSAPHTLEEAYELFNKVKESGEISFEWENRRKNGQLFWTDNVMKIVKIGGQFRIIVLSQDITERKKYHLQLQSLVREHSREIHELNERLTLANEELKIINEELENYKVQLEELVAIRTQELKRSEEKFSNVFHHSPYFIIVSNTLSGTILEVNEAFTRKFGFTTEELTGKTLLYHNIIEKNQFKKIQNLISRQGYYKNQEFSLITKKKEKLFCLGSGERVVIGHHSFLIETISDITELKTIEQRLSLTEIRYSNFIEQSMEGVSYFRPTVPIDISLPAIDQAWKLLHTGILVECNDSYSKMYGYESRNYLFNKTMLEISGDILEDDWLKMLTEFIQSGYRLTNYPLNEIAEDSTLSYFIHNLIGIIQDRKLIGVWNSRHNITDLKKAEELLQYKNKLEQLITGISTRFFNLTPDQVDVNIENALHEVCDYINADEGFLIEIVYSQGYYHLTHAWKNDTIRYDEHYFEKAPLKDLEKWIISGQKSEYYLLNSPDILPENSFIKSSFLKSGTISLVLIPIKLRGNLVEIAGFGTSKFGKTWTQDEISFLKLIGETLINAVIRKNSENILIESERNYREIFNATNEAIFIHNAQTGKTIDANQAALDLFGVTYREVIGTTSGETEVLDLGFNQISFREFMHQALEKKGLVFEWLAHRKNGESFWAEVSQKSSEIGGDLKVITVLRDVSERKKNEELIRQSEERFRSIIQYLTDIILILDRNLVITYESPSAAQVLGYDPGSLINLPGMQLIHPDDQELIIHDLKDVFFKRNDYLPTEFRAKHRDGHWISFEAIANNMLDHPAIHGIIVTCRDITERKMVEKALKISESKFRNIFNNSSDAIIMVNYNYSILEVNDVFLKMTGYSIEETRKLKVTDIITDTYLPAVVDKLIRLFQHENLPALECEIRCKSKLSMPVEIKSKLIEFEGEMALVSIIRDITERRQLENRILDTIISTEEKEREKFARNLHDELGPLLSSIKMYINSLSAGIEKQKHDFIISQLKRILTEAIQSTKELSNDLSPHVLLNYGLVAALEWFNNQIKPYISVTLESNLKDSRYSSSLELAIYRIIKELINNTIKHANARSITIKLHLILGSIRLVYSDNGAGFPDKWHENLEFLGMGMSNIMSRCRSINAVSKFYNHTPHGMSFEMEVPV
jgi:PAS domain S-box-containing protein